MTNAKYRQLFLFGALLLWSLTLLSCSKTELSKLPDNAKILAFGDSLTSGKGVKPEHSYPSVLEKIISRTVINAGISGETTAQGANRIEAVLTKENPDFVILIEGGNDILRNYSLQETETQLAKMIESIQAKDIPLVLVGVPPKSLFSSSCASYYETLADKYQIPLDCHTIGELLRDNRYKSDAVHFNEKGYALLAERIAELMSDSGAI